MTLLTEPRLRRVAIRLLVLVLAAPAAGASALAQAVAPEKLETAEGVVTELYDLVTFEAGQTPNWDAVRGLFIDEAVIVLRTGRDETTVFSVETWIQDFVTFIERAEVEKTGFTEAITRMSPTVFGDVANVWVLYEASVPGSGRPPQQGVDNFSLVRRDGRWWVAAITNEIPAVAGPVPEALRD
jgi:hypothetical protein